MSITAQKKQQVIADYRRDDKDTGSPEVQVAVLTARIKELTEHLKQNRHDYASQRGLLQMVSKRNRLLRYLKRTKRASYLELIARLGLRK
ncbi:MAG: 30S ribosomal protein S15 [Planctomycetota bacterium]